jgi:Holliday junction resolvase RusA-like endonuclease
MIKFEVLGIPVPQGSKEGFYNPKLKRVMMVESNKKTQPWRDSVAAAAAQAYPVEHFPVIRSAVDVTLFFFFPFRAQDLKKDGTPRARGMVPKISKPDLDKLIRAVLDSITAAGVWIDDSIVTDLTAKKRYSRQPGVKAVIQEIEELQYDL